MNFSQKRFPTPRRTIFFLKHLNGFFCKLCEMTDSKIIDNNKRCYESRKKYKYNFDWILIDFDQMSTKSLSQVTLYYTYFISFSSHTCQFVLGLK